MHLHYRGAILQCFLYCYMSTTESRAYPKLRKIAKICPWADVDAVLQVCHYCITTWWKICSIQHDLIHGLQNPH